MTRTGALAAVVIVGAIASCTNRPLVKTEPKTESYVMEVLEQAELVPIDILVIVDNSLSMTEEQVNLAEEFPSLIRNLLDPPLDGTGKPVHLPVRDLHIGVISTDMGTSGVAVDGCADPVDGDDGILQHDPSPEMPGCAATYPNYLSYASATPDAALVDRLATDFGCISVLGTDGCGFEQQLEAALKALTVHAAGANAGFIRDGSLLTILFVTDEEDCSVAPGNEEIFDFMGRPELGPANLRCFLHPEMIHPIQRYVDGFRSLKDTDRLLFGFIVGVPEGTACEGFGDGIGDCLASPDMIERQADADSLVPSCSSPNGVAFPARRFVEVAQSFGSTALVHSICAADFAPAIEGLTAKLIDMWNGLLPARELETGKDPLDPCLCLATCSVIEELTDARPCPDGRPCFEPAGPGTGCAFKTDDAGIRHSLCVIPQAGTRLADCSLECADPASVHTPAGEGWYYLPYNEVGIPQVLFTDSMVPSEGATVYIQCESMICPENRQCGPAGFESSRCCDMEAYCDRASSAGPTCVLRPD